MLEAWRKAAARLTRIDRREFFDRSGQEVAKRLDAVLSLFGFDFTQGSIRFENAKRGRFYFAPESVESVLGLLRQRLPGQVELIIRQAEKICRHRFDLLGYEDLEYGHPIDWHLDAVHGKRAPKKPFHKIRYLDFDHVGDSKVTWELNRHQHLVTLTKAYRLTADPRYANEIVQEWRQWQVENPYPVGINWASSLEVAFRSLSWVWVYQLLEDTPALPPGFRKDWLRTQALNGRHIERYLSTYFSPNTHLLGEGVALFFLGTLCPELSRAERWKSRGWEIILRELQRQVLPDGFHFERSTYYHVYAIDLFLHAAVLASLNEVAIPTEVEKTLEKMLDALSLQARAGEPPHLGDDDGGRLFDPRRNRFEHLLDPLAAGAILFKRGDFKAAVGELREEAIWLLGEQGVAEWDRLPSEHPALASASLPTVGQYLVTTANPPSQLLIDAGSQDTGSPGHNHSNALSICLQSKGHALLIDPGTFEYVGEGPERDRFRSTARHNTLRVDGASQSEPAGPFAWKQFTHAKAERWVNGENFDLFVGTHDNYCRLPSPVVHRRWVVSLKSGLFLVRDLAQGTGKHRLDIAWHLGPQLQMRAEGLFGMKAASDGLAILCVDKHGWSEEVRKDVWSPVYGKKEPITVLNFGTVASLPAEFATLIIPLEEVKGIPGSLTVTKESASPVKAYLYRASSEECSFFFAEMARPWNHGRLASDAEFVCWQTMTEDESELLIFCNGSYVEIDGKRVASCTRTILRYEMMSRDGAKVIHASEPDALLEMQLTTPGPEENLDT
jgi:Heparinase II/III-like protein/Heparinase II/III N-terminus